MNEQQLRDDLVREQDKNIFLIAGAGAGKSSLMVNRIIEQAKLKKDDEMFKRMVAITFTNKATMELEEKVMDALLDLPESEEKERLLAEQHDLTIATIHSFCQQILQARPLEAGLSPNFGLIEETEAKELFQAILYDVFHGDFAKTDEGYAFMVENGFELSMYVDMLYSQALHHELGLEETSLSIDLQKEEAASRAFLDEVIQLVLEHQIPQNTAVSYYPLANLKKINPKLPLRDFIIESYRNKSGDRYEAIKEVLYADNGGKQLKEKLDDTYSVEVFGEGRYVDEADFADDVMQFINGLFESKVKLLIRENNLSTDTLFANREAVETDMPYIKAWTNELENIIAETREDHIEPLFDHIFNKTFIYDEVRPLLTPTQKSLYYNIDVSNVQELIQLLTGDVYRKPAVLAELKDKLVLYRDKRHIYFTQSMQLKIVLQRLFRQVIERYEEEKLKRNVVTNNDLLMKTAQLLKEEAVRDYFHAKYRYIYVDEYQDTDPLQTEILLYLTSETMPTSVEDAKPTAGSLFVVGDPKQSIYRFRNADLRIYNQMKEMATSDEHWRVENLYANFRSNNPLIHWFNKTFHPLFEEEANSFIQPSYDKMSVKAEDNNPAEWDKRLTGIYKLNVMGNKAEEQRENEAEKIAAWIDEQCVKEQTCTFKDVLIITPSNADVVYYVNALKARGIPTSFSGKIDISDFPEIVRLAYMIDYFVRPNRLKKYRLLAYSFKISFSLFKEYEDSEEERKQVAARFANIRLALEMLSRYSKLARELRPMEFLSTLVYDARFGIYDTATTRVDYDGARSILTTLIERVRIYNPQTLSDLAAYLMKQLDESIEYEIQADNDSNEVRIMNLHKTKGLEAKIVFLACPKNARARMGRPTKIVTRDGWNEEIEYALYTKYGQGQASIKYFTEAFYEKKQAELKHEEAERIRTIYVAATRAEEMLVITQVEGKQGNTWDDLIGDDLSELTLSPETEHAEMEQDVWYIPIHRETVLIEEQIVSVDKWHSYQTLLPSDRGAYAMKVDEIKAEEISLEVAIANENAPYKGPLWGNLVHAGIECLLKSSEHSLDEKMYREALRNGLEQYELTERELRILGDVGVGDGGKKTDILLQLEENVALQTALTKYVEQFFHHEQSVMWLESHTAFPEFPFTAWLSEADARSLQLKESEGNDDKPVLVRGVIDLVLQSKDTDKKNIIIDYKTDRMLEDESVEAFTSRLIKAYGQQLQTYKTVLQKMSPKDSPIQIYIYAVTIDEFISC